MHARDWWIGGKKLPSQNDALTKIRNIGVNQLQVLDQRMQNYSLLDLHQVLTAQIAQGASLLEIVQEIGYIELSIEMV